MMDLMDPLITIGLLIAFSIGGRALLVAMGQRWVTTFAHTATLTTLPIITFVITKVISGNIALSLGMVGALSIVRFRNPVKSPFELAVYFTAITMGIAASVSLKWLIFLVFAIAAALFTLAILARVWPLIAGKPYFETSFSEGNRLSTLEVEAKCALTGLQDNPNLISLSQREDRFLYILATDKFAVLKSEMAKLQDNPSVLQVQLNK